MLRYTLKYALRNIWNNRIISVLNVVGLTLAVLSLLFIFFYLRFELSFDKFHNDYQRVYNVYFDECNEGVRDVYVQAPIALGTNLAEDFPEVESVTRLYIAPNTIVKGNDGKEYTDNVVWADSSFFDVFSLKLRSGSAAKTLHSPNQICISHRCAQKYFPDQSPVGKVLTINDQKYEVTAISENYPENSHLAFDLIGSFSSITKGRDIHEWDGYMYHTYIKLRNNVKVGEFEKKLPFIISNRMGPFVAKRYGLNIKEWYSRGNRIDLKLIPISKIHLYGSKITGFDNQNNISNVILIIAVSGLILFIACFNFMNFNVSLFRKNYQTIGIKKICGFSKLSISIQVFLEAFVIFFIAATLAFIIIYGARSNISGLLKCTIINPDAVKGIFFMLIVSGIVIAFVCGYIPIVRNIRKDTSIQVKNNLRMSNDLVSSGKILFGMQFMISIIILIFLLVIDKQVNLITTQNLGFDKENILILHRTNRDRNKAKILAGELRNIPGIKAVSVTNAYPGDALPTKDLQLKDSPNGFSYSPQYLCCDSSMRDVLNFKLVKGEFFSGNISENSILLNEKATRTFGIEKDPIGKVFSRGSGKYTYHVIGVIKDFNFKSLHHPIEPLCIYTGYDHSNAMGASKILVKLGNKKKELLSAIKQKWKVIYNDAYFDCSFLDDEIDHLYSRELLLKKVIPLSALLAFAISIIGLVGISYIKMIEKTKEIGIRKVNGARVSEILTMLNKDFIKWISIAFVVACPIAYYAMRQWLQNFAYKTELSWWVFAVAGIVAMAVAVITVSWQSYKAATRNPVESLRYE